MMVQGRWVSVAEPTGLNATAPGRFTPPCESETIVFATTKPPPTSKITVMLFYSYFEI